MRERMMEKKTFSVTVAKSAVKLDAKRVGKASFTVTNTSDKLAIGALDVNRDACSACGR
jgi:hypothetical protein